MNFIERAAFYKMHLESWGVASDMEVLNNLEVKALALHQTYCDSVLKSRCDGEFVQAEEFSRIVDRISSTPEYLSALQKTADYIKKSINGC